MAGDIGIARQIEAVLGYRNIYFPCLAFLARPGQGGGSGKRVKNYVGINSLLSLRPASCPLLLTVVPSLNTF